MPATAWETLKFPFVAVGRLVKLLILPALLATVAWLVFGTDSPVFVGVAIIAAVWGLAMVGLWRLQIRGRLRSLSRGAVRVAPKGDRW